MTQQAKFLDDGSLHYRRIALVLAVILLYAVGFWLIGFKQRTPESDLQSVKMPGYFNGVKKVTIINEGYSMIPIDYGSFDPKGQGYDSGSRELQPEFTKNNDGTEVTVRFDGDDNYHQASLIIRGASLDVFELRGPVEVDYHQTGSSLTVLNHGAAFNLATGQKNLVLVNEDEATSRLDFGFIDNLDITLRSGRVTVGRVKTLKVDMDECLNADTNKTLAVMAVQSGRMTYRNLEQPARSIVTPCSNLVIGPSELQ